MEPFPLFLINESVSCFRNISGPKFRFNLERFVNSIIKINTACSFSSVKQIFLITLNLAFSNCLEILVSFLLSWPHKISGLLFCILNSIINKFDLILLIIFELDLSGLLKNSIDGSFRKSLDANTNFARHSG